MKVDNTATLTLTGGAKLYVSGITIPDTVTGEVIKVEPGSELVIADPSVMICSDSCSLGVPQCNVAEDGVQTCGNYDGDICWEWSPDSLCDDNPCYEPLCVDGACDVNGAPVADRDTDESCHDDTGCVGGGCSCDGAGTCRGCEPPCPDPSEWSSWGADYCGMSGWRHAIYHDRTRSVYTCVDRACQESVETDTERVERCGWGEVCDACVQCIDSGSAIDTVTCNADCAGFCGEVSGTDSCGNACTKDCGLCGTCGSAVDTCLSGTYVDISDGECKINWKCEGVGGNDTSAWCQEDKPDGTACGFPVPGECYQGGCAYYCFWSYLGSSGDCYDVTALENGEVLGYGNVYACPYPDADPWSYEETPCDEATQDGFSFYCHDPFSCGAGAGEGVDEMLCDCHRGEGPPVSDGQCAGYTDTCGAGTWSDEPDTECEHVWRCSGTSTYRTCTSDKDDGTACSGGTCSGGACTDGQCSTDTNTCVDGAFSDEPDTDCENVWRCAETICTSDKADGTACSGGTCSGGACVAASCRLASSLGPACFSDGCISYGFTDEDGNPCPYNVGDVCPCGDTCTEKFHGGGCASDCWGTVYACQ